MNYESHQQESSARPIPLSLAAFPVIVLVGLLSVNVYLYGDAASSGPNQIALLMAAAAAAIVGTAMKVPYREQVEGVKRSIGSALVAMLILLLIGALTGTWMISGIVPAMVYYGLGLLNAETFLFASALVCAVVSVATGSSWSTVATVGIALLGIGKVLGVSEAMVAGAIISGAYFGDKISPLSDTTNLASAMAGTELITHVRYMLWTTMPSFCIALAIYLAIGMMSQPAELLSDHEALKTQLASRFVLSPWVFVVPAGVVIMVLMRVDALIAIFVGAIAGAVLAVFLQPDVVTQIAGLPEQEIVTKDQDGNTTTAQSPPAYAVRAYTAAINALSAETSIIDSDRVDELKVRQAKLSEQIEEAETAVAPPSANRFDQSDMAKENLDSAIMTHRLRQELSHVNAEIAAAGLLKGKGMQGMLNTIWLIITAMCFGGLMEACGLLQRLTEPLVALAKSTTSLVATTAGSCLFVNLTASDQYLAIVVPGRMFRETFRERKLAAENLSRTLEDSGTVTSVLIPWNTCGAAQNSVLDVEVLHFAPFCFFNIISPLMTILFASFGRLRPLQESKTDRE
jgi:NhaC family Na+:H+ antiporter